MKQVLDDDAVQTVPASFKMALAEHARSGKNVGIPLTTLQLVEGVAAKLLVADKQDVEAAKVAEQQAPVMLGD